VTGYRIRSLPKPPIVDFVSEDNNNLITTHYFKDLNSLIIVPTTAAVLWTTVHTPRRPSSIYLHPKFEMLYSVSDKTDVRHAMRLSSV